MKRRYETMFIITPLLPEEEVKEIIGNYRNFLEQQGAKLLYEEFWGLRKLAYPIDKKQSGFYHLFEYEAAADVPKKLEKRFLTDEHVMRFLTVHLDKHAIEYNERKRAGKVGRSFAVETKVY